MYHSLSCKPLNTLSAGHYTLSTLNFVLFLSLAQEPFVSLP